MTPIITKLAGVSFDGIQENIKRFGCAEIGSYALVRESDNQHDPNAVKVMLGKVMMGYLPSANARELAPLMDAGKRFIAYFLHSNESPHHQTVGLTIRIMELDDQEDAGPVAA